MIELRDIVLAYENRTILDHVDLTIHDGETLAILGGSGAGKSTLLKLIIGLLRPTSGTILVDGIDITKISDEEFDRLRQTMGMVFQYSALFDSMSVGENVAFGLRQHTTMTEEEIQHTVARKLRMVGLPKTENYMPNELSGGMKKRISLARAIALDPNIILYDEPTSGLDPITSGTISHDMQSAFFVADRIALLDKGKFIEVSETNAFKNSKNPKVQQFIEGRKSVKKDEIEKGEI